MPYKFIERRQAPTGRGLAFAVAFSYFTAGAFAGDTVVLELQRSTTLQEWESVSISEEMLGYDGKIRFPSEGSASFFRLKVGMRPDEPAPEGMVLIPADTYEMGDNFEEWNDNERPVHSVYISAFYMGVTAVTKAQWDEVRMWAVGNGYADLPAGEGKDTNHPVHSVNWYDAVKWLNARSEKEELVPVYRLGDVVYRTGRDEPTIVYSANGYRLPTEAEWEKAARGGLTGNRFPWGDTISHYDANYYADGSAYDYDLSPYSEPTIHPLYRDMTFPFTSPVAAFPPNGYGLYDMAGNVWEMCNDWWGRSYNDQFPVADPRGPPSGTARMKRGGNWMTTAIGARVAYRNNMYPETADIHTGFRFVRGSLP